MEIAIIILVFLEVFLLVILYLIFINGRKIRKEIKQLEDSVDTSMAVIFRNEYIKKLPEPVQRYFRYVLKDGQEHINIIRIIQSGSIRLKEGKKWAKLKAVQYFNGQKPGFIWVANAKVSPFFWISAREKYFNSSGSMLLRLFSLFTITNSTGEEMAISSLIRYISETPWFPTSLLPSNYLSWEPLDKNSAGALIKNGKFKTRVTFYFNSTGEITAVTSPERFRFAGGKYYREKWTGYFKNYREINGIRIPTEAEAAWNTKGGNSKYIRIKIEKIKYN